MGQTRVGKSRLSIELATLFPVESINSDKIQVHEGLDIVIVTNKITEEERKRVPHHFQLPVIAGDSNSYIEALIDDVDHRFRSKFDPCFLWVEVTTPVLYQYVSEQVDRMVKNGMINKVREFSPSAGIKKGDQESDWSSGVQYVLPTGTVSGQRKQSRVAEEPAVDAIVLFFTTASSQGSSSARARPRWTR
ncbi:hypothetical protein SLEP1_g4308 [Rubroshorea leprosula]|uniref:Uncharacterized protein n=1 Tax=Rubroshorea leprosula TaxID=152421 RepID=A0AAV5HX59_9ROSI|nr:hypothetical protein SLEP1_g4308 [Rubroshorea leprosula]